MPLKDLVKKYEGNPILTADDVEGSIAVYNCAATKFKGEYILLVSVTRPNAPGCGKAIHVAESDDGIHFKVRDEPFISSDDPGPYTEFDYDICDPRITYLEGTYYITYPAHKPGIGVVPVLGKTADFETFERLCYAGLPSNRVSVLFPEKINGEYARLDRPYGLNKGDMWLSYSPDLIHWGKHRYFMGPGGKIWNDMKVGPSGPPIKTDKGWLLIYHTVSGGQPIGPIAYYQACALLDLEDPGKIISRPEEFIMRPDAPHEKGNGVPDVVFCCGHILEPDGELKIYFAGADNCVCLATAKLDELVDACLAAMK